jgi:hypothetical protein
MCPVMSQPLIPDELWEAIEPLLLRTPQAAPWPRALSVPLAQAVDDPATGRCLGLSRPFARVEGHQQREQHRVEQQREAVLAEGAAPLSRS